MSYNGIPDNIPSDSNDRIPPYDKFGSPYNVANQNPTSKYHAKRADSMVQIHPIEGESVHSYIQRIQAILKHWEDANLQAHVYGRKVWYTHRNPSGCWLCDGITFIWNLYGQLHSVAQHLPNKGTEHFYKASSGGLIHIVYRPNTPPKTT